MKFFNTRSMGFKTALMYLFLTVLNISIFVLMVFENQLDLIAENAILNSQHTASSLKARIDRIMAKSGELSPVYINKIIREAVSLGISDLTLYGENGSVFVDVSGNKITGKKAAGVDELAMIKTAVTQQGFEGRLFSHSVNRKQRAISLYVPFSYGVDKICVASVRLPMKDIDKQMTYLYRQCLVIGVLVMLVHVLFALLFSKMILLPIRRLSAATRKIAQGQLNVRVPIVRDDEIGQLASSFNEMSVAFQRMRDEAKGANPLTGLPGNIVIANYINDCLLNARIVCVLYCDCDNFKAYNDKYGFTKGDEVILFTRDCLIGVAKRDDMGGVFIGHEGGDDFVAVSRYEQWETFAKSFIALFDKGIHKYYSAADNHNGYIESVNRRGERQRFPIMSVSVAVVTNRTRDFHSLAEMIQVAAEVKKYVKSIEGSSYTIDRRSGPIRTPQPDADMRMYFTESNRPV
jgi:diguanylate cyclase (GGDEF)-like protein